MALAGWLSARARGRSAEQLRSAVDSPKGVEGTAAAAASLGFTDAADGALTELGERYALADEGERRRLLLERMRSYPPYREALLELAERGRPTETEVRWIEAFWSTRGFGGSESNRREGAAAFGRLADFAGLGEYIPGRRGRPTRIRWHDGAFSPDTTASPALVPSHHPAGADSEEEPDLFTAAPPPPAPTPPPTAPTLDTPERVRPRPPSPAPDRETARPPVRSRDGRPVNRVTVALSGDAVARLEVPLRLPSAEKRRLLELLERLISDE